MWKQFCHLFSCSLLSLTVVEINLLGDTDIKPLNVDSEQHLAGIKEQVTNVVTPTTPKDACHLVIVHWPPVRKTTPSSEKKADNE